MQNRLGLLAVLAAALGSSALVAQTNYTWTGAGADTNWNTAGHWTPAGGPPGIGTTDNALFTPFGSTAAGTTVQFTNSPNILGLIIAPNRNGGGWTFTQSGSQSLTAGGSGSTGITTTGLGTYTLNGPTLAGASGPNTLALNVTSGSTLVFSGGTAVTANQGAVNIAGGTLRLDNAATNNTARLLSAAANTVTVNGGGTLELVGHSAGTTQNLGNLYTANSGLGGNNVIRVTSNGALTQLNFTGTTSSSLRGGTRTTFDFQSASGRLGDSNGGRITFGIIPFLGSSHLFANGAGAGTVGFATVTDSLGKNFATYANPSDTQAAGVVSVANPNQTRVTVTAVTTATGLAGLTANTVAQFDAAAGTTTATGTVTAATLRISPASGATLAMGANNLSVAGLMLDGATNFTISGTGLLGIGSGTRYFYVNDATATLTTNMLFTSGTNAAVFAGPGFVELTGTSIQNNGTLGNAYRVSLTGGVLRGNNTQIGFTTTRGVLGLVGGVLEISGGTNGTGTSADFTRALGTSGGNVNWGAGTSQDVGSGGFSAFGANASVNIGGAATPASLRWAQASFVDNGYALKFGSTQSDSTLTFYNPIQLDAAIQPAYVLREFNVTRGSGGTNDKTVLAGVVSGVSGADFLKTGTGVLELTATNTYAGNTVVRGGELRVTGALGTGNVLTQNGATLSGTGSVGGPTSVLSGGTIRGDSGSMTGTLTTGNVTVQDGGQLGVQLGTGTAASRLNTSAGVLDLNSNAIIDPNGTFAGGGDRVLATLSSSAGGLVIGGTAYDSDTTGPTPIATYTYVTNDTGLKTFGALQIDVTGLGLANDDKLTLNRNASNQLILTFTPVPEPGLMLAVCGLAVGGVVTVRKLRRKAKPADVTPVA